MSSDKLAYWGFVIGAVSLGFTVVAAIAAVFAAVYARGSATRKTLEAVRENTDETAQQVTAVRTHVAQVDGHLKTQNERHDLDAAGDRASMVVTGEAWADEVFPLIFTLHADDFVLHQIELVNDGNFSAGAFPCKRLNEQDYRTNIAPDSFGKWYNNGKYQTQGENRTVSIKATLMRGESRTSKTFSLTATMAFRQGKAGTSYYNRVDGEC
jgi:hypothetical protein